jgi:23S rRNA (uridine2552-2'-O)-methyltransferase
VRVKKHKRNQWLQRHARDVYVRKAKADGYRSRAVYKLIEIDRRDRLLRPGLTVVELGAAPGSWSQHVWDRISPGGTLIAVDIEEMTPIAGVTLVRGDIADAAVIQRIIEQLGGRGRADLVISDMAPNITGIRALDQSRALALVEHSLVVATAVLAPGGHMLVKLFEGEGVNGFRRRCALYFSKCVIRKPAASRAKSREMYLLANGFIGETGSKAVVRGVKP